MRELDSLSADDFAGLVGERFRLVLEPPAAAGELTLAELEQGPPGPERRQFSLRFRGGPEEPLPQRIYRLEHDRLGPLELFLVPLGPEGDAQRYEAVFT